MKVGKNMLLSVLSSRVEKKSIIFISLSWSRPLIKTRKLMNITKDRFNKEIHFLSKTSVLVLLITAFHFLFHNFYSSSDS